ncbi:acyl-CoA thioesterase [Bradyrhizobium sp. USDA 4451]
MSKCSDGLLGVLDLETVGVDLFRGKSPRTSWRWVFGGQVIGQAMVAACRTAKGRLPHSLHCYFLLPGDPQLPLEYEVERLRDGKRYSTRRVTAAQKSTPISSIMVSFHAEEDGIFDHQEQMPPVPQPNKNAANEVSEQPVFAEPMEFIRRNYAIDLCPVEIGRHLGQKTEDGRIYTWVKCAAQLPDDPVLHLCVLAYISDMSLLGAVTARYGRTLFDKGIVSLSLDHAMWFHRPCRADEWLLSAQDSPSAQGGRGLARGLIFKTDGTLVAFATQEGSVRRRR